MDEKALTVDTLAQEIRRVDGNHSLGAGALAEALMPFITSTLSPGSTGETEGWRDIESAPKDVRIFAWGPGWHWCQGETAFLHSDYNGNTGIICRGGQCGTPFRLGSKDAPTLWAPLPAPPSAMLSAAGERG